MTRIASIIGIYIYEEKRDLGGFVALPACGTSGLVVMLALLSGCINEGYANDD